MNEQDHSDIINDVRRDLLRNNPDYFLVDKKGNETSIIFERSGDLCLVFAHVRYSGGWEKELGGVGAHSFEGAVKSLLGNRYLPFYRLQIPK